MKQSGGIYVSVGIAACYFAVNVYQTVSVWHIYMGLDFTINGPRDVNFVFNFQLVLPLHISTIEELYYIK
jgi:hypothetical protein